jgi:hypothetical protein
MKRVLQAVMKSCLAVLLFGGSALVCNSESAADAALRDGSARVVFVGDSITGQGGGWVGTGYVFKMRDALNAVYPGAKPDLVPLGGSGMGVGAWLGLAKDAGKQKRDLDVKGVEVGAGEDVQENSQRKCLRGTKFHLLSRYAPLP